MRSDGVVWEVALRVLWRCDLNKRIAVFMCFFFSSRRRHTRWTGDWSSDVCSSDLTARCFTIGIAGAGEKDAETATLDDHLATAVVAILGRILAFDFLTAGIGNVADVITFRIARAAEEESVAADALEESALLAFRAFLVGGDAGLVEVFLEAIPEFLDGLAPGELAFLDFVKLVFEARGEADVEDVLETLDEQVADFFAEERGGELPLILVHVFALNDGGNNRGVSGRPADALFLEFLDERRFGVARRRLGEMLLGADFFEAQALAFGDARQAAAFRFGVVFLRGGSARGGVGGFALVFVFARSLIGGEVAVEFLDGAAGAEKIVAGGDVDGGLVEDSGNHLRADEALPNHLVELEHVFVEIALDAIGRARDIGGPDGFVGFLRLLFRFEEIRLLRNIFIAVARGNVLADLSDCFI